MLDAKSVAECPSRPKRAGALHLLPHCFCQMRAAQYSPWELRVPVFKKGRAMIRQLRKPYVVVLLLALPALLRMASWGSPAPRSVDPQTARMGRDLFEHAWTPGDPL